MLESQKYSECQLVTAINAAAHLGELPVRPETEEYERLVDLVHARNGAAIAICRALPYLRIKRKAMPLRWSAVKRALDQGLPVGLDVYCTRIGLHSILCTDYRERRRLQFLRVWNLKSAPSGWISWHWLKTHRGDDWWSVREKAYQYEVDSLYKSKKNTLEK